MPIAVIAFDFDPLLHLFESLVVRWQTVALAVVIATALIAAGWTARRVGLRPDDLLIITVGVVPGAVIGGRIGFALLHVDYYGTRLAELLDPTIGGLELGLAVVGGLLTGCAVAGLLGAPVGRWMHLVTLPVLFVLGAGKLTMALGGAGQGQPSTEAWATAYLGPGPWGSIAPALPSVPSQIIEGAVTLLIAIAFALLLMVGAFRSAQPRGWVLLLALGAWSIGRAVVALTWRDPAVVGQMPMGSVIAVGMATGFLVAAVIVAARTSRSGRTSAGASSGADAAPTPGSPGSDDPTVAGHPVTAGTEPNWPDPEDRPTI